MGRPRLLCATLSLLLAYITCASSQANYEVRPSVPATAFQAPILVAAPEAERTTPTTLPCPDIDNFNVDPSTLMPPGDAYKPAFTFRANGFRNYSCNFPGPVVRLPGTARTQISGDFVGSGGYNADRLPEIVLAIPGTNEPAGRLILDPSPVTFQGLGENVEWARWRVLIISGTHVPWVVFNTMNETEGGAHPTAEQCAGRSWFESPYTARYTYWAC